MKLKKYIQYGEAALVIAIALALTACGNSKSSNSSNNGAVAGAFVSPYETNNDSAYLADNFQYKNLTVSSSANYKPFLKKALGVCDRLANSGGIYGCDSWTNSYFRLIVQAQSTVASTLRAVFMVYPQISSYGWYGYQLPTWEQFFMGALGFPVPQQIGAVRNPLALDMTVSLVNKSQGFTGISYGAADTLANSSNIQVMVRNGKILDQTLPVELYFEGQQFASGTLYRCTYPNCQ
jgi:hypothetical protein